MFHLIIPAPYLVSDTVFAALIFRIPYDLSQWYHANSTDKGKQAVSLKDTTININQTKYLSIRCQLCPVYRGFLQKLSFPLSVPFLSFSII